MRSRRDVVALLTLGAAGLAGCSGSPDDTTATDPRGTEPGTPTEGGTETAVPDGTVPDAVAPPTDLVERATWGHATFGWNVVRTTDGNAVCSPYSIGVALAMASAGAVGETDAQLTDVLGFPDEPDRHEAYGELGAALDARTIESEGTENGDENEDENEDGEEDPPLELLFANGVWGQDGLPYADAFVETMDTQYAAGFHRANFREAPEAARRAINDRVGEQTGGRIANLIPESGVTQTTRVVLTNAITLLAAWDEGFEAGGDLTFTGRSGTTETVPAMTKEDRVRVAELYGHRAAEFPYVGGDLSMLVVLPTEGSYPAIREAMSPGLVERFVEELATEPATVRLPKFGAETDLELSTTFEALGADVPFDPNRANFADLVRTGEIDGVTDADGENYHVESVYHEAEIGVDEDGTEAAAATAAVIHTVSPHPNDAFEFVADRPFLFAIRDRPTGALLFCGAIEEPGDDWG